MTCGDLSSGLNGDWKASKRALVPRLGIHLRGPQWKLLAYLPVTDLDPHYGSFIHSHRPRGGWVPQSGSPQFGNSYEVLK